MTAPAATMAPSGADTSAIACGSGATDASERRPQQALRDDLHSDAQAGIDASAAMMARGMVRAGSRTSPETASDGFDAGEQEDAQDCGAADIGAAAAADERQGKIAGRDEPDADPDEQCQRHQLDARHERDDARGNADTAQVESARVMAEPADQRQIAHRAASERRNDCAESIGGGGRDAGDPEQPPLAQLSAPVRNAPIRPEGGVDKGRDAAGWSARGCTPSAKQSSTEPTARRRRDRRAAHSCRPRRPSAPGMVKMPLPTARR